MWYSVAGVVAVPFLFSLPDDVLTSVIRCMVTHVHTANTVPKTHNYYFDILRTVHRDIRGLSGKYPSILNITRTGRVALI